MTEGSLTWQADASTGSQQTGQSLHTATLPHLTQAPARLKLLRSPQAGLAAVSVGSVQHERDPTLSECALFPLSLNVSP